MILKLICLGYLDYIDYLGYHSCHDMGDNLISSISGSHQVVIRHMGQCIKLCVSVYVSGYIFPANIK